MSWSQCPNPESVERRKKKSKEEKEVLENQRLLKELHQYRKQKNLIDTIFKVKSGE